MHLVTYSNANQTQIGVVIDQQVINLHEVYKHMLEAQGKIRAQQIADAYIPTDMVGFLEGGSESMALAQETVQYAQKNKDVLTNLGYIHEIENIRLEAPVQTPKKIICVGHNYREHILEMNREIPDHPVLFAKFSNTILGPEDDIPLAPVTEKLDYEAEFAFVIGKQARNVKQKDAFDYVAGYTIANDISARDMQLRTLQWLQGKTLDGSAPMGPWLVTKDEVATPNNLNIKLTVNGDVRQSSNTENLVFDVPRLVEFLSEFMVLDPGDIILTGTPGGVGLAEKPPVFLQDGDVVRIELDNIGVLENTVKSTK